MNDQRAFLLRIAYDGTNYFGWQRQPDQPTVQANLETALARLMKRQRVIVRASSRTDTGVHAEGQAACILSDNWRAPADRIPLAVNSYLPSDIVVRSAQEVPLEFHPLRDCSGKRYRYQVYQARISDPLHGRYHWWVRKRMDNQRMQAAAELLLGEHDFYSFQSAGSPRQDTVRTVRRLEIKEAEHMDGRLFTFVIEADGFLYNMVRNIVGTLVKVGQGGESVNWVGEVLAAKDRRLAGATAPPQGLCLQQVFFNPSPVDARREA